MKHLIDNNFNENKLVNVPMPVNPADAVNKAYVDSKVGEEVYARDFGVVADGVTDDTTAMQSAADYIVSNGGTLILPSGRIAISTGIRVQDATRPFTIKGAGMNVTTIIRNHDSVGSPLIISSSDHFTVQDLGIDCRHSDLPNGNHGLAMSRVNNVRIRRVYVTNWKNSSIILSTPPDGVKAENVVFEDCVCDGLNSANNGFLISTAHNSGLLNCKALNIGKSGSPCYALQLKNDCQQCFIIGGLASGASAGLALGQELDSISVQRSVFSDVAVDSCEIGVITGFARQNVFSNITINMASIGTRAIDLISSSENSFSNLNIQGVPSNREVIRLHNSDFNSIDVGYFRNINATPELVKCVISSDYNVIKVGNTNNIPVSNPNAMLTEDDNSTNNTLIFESLMGAWRSWNPAYSNFVLGNGSVKAAYQLVGKTVNFRLKITLGSTSSVSGRIQFTLPVPLSSEYDVSIGDSINSFACVRGGSPPRTSLALIVIDGPDRLGIGNQLVDGLTFTSTSSTSPFTWGAGSVVTVNGAYEAA